MKKSARRGSGAEKGPAPIIATMEAIVRYALYFSLAAPLFFWKGFTDPFATCKTVPFGLAVSLAAGASLVVLWREGPGRTGNGWAPHRSPVWLALLAFWLYCIVAAAFGVDFHRSLWGVAERQDGLFLPALMLVWTALILWYSARRAGAQAAAGRAARKEAARGGGLHAWLRFSFWVSAVVAAAAVWEWLERILDFHWFVPDLLREANQGRPGGTIGSPTFLSPYLLFHFFYGIHYLTALGRPGGAPGKPAASGRAARVGWRRGSWWAVLAALGLMIVAIVVAQTRGAYLGLAAGVLLLAIWTAIRPAWGRISRYAALSALLSIPLLAGWVWYLQKNPDPTRHPLLQRVADPTLFQTAPVQERLIFWKGAVESFRDHPLIGWGHNNIYYGLNRHYNPELLRSVYMHSSFVVYDKVHNYYLELLAEKGLIGAALWLLMVAWIVARLLRLPDRVLAMTTWAGLLAYAVASVFAFDSFATLLACFLFLTPLMEQGSGSRAAAAAISGRQAGDRPPAADGMAAMARKALLAAGFLAALGGAYVFSQIGLASAAFWTARGVAAANPNLGMGAYNRAFAFNSPYRDKEKIECALSVVGSLLAGQPANDKKALCAEAMALADEAARAFPNDLAIYTQLADQCNNLGLRIDAGYLDWAVRYGEAARRLSPLRQQGVFFLARALILKGETGKAVAATQALVSAYPDHALAHWYHGLSLLADKRRDAAEEYMKRSWKLGYRWRSAEEEKMVREMLGEAGYQRLTADK